LWRNISGEYEIVNHTNGRRALRSSYQWVFFSTYRKINDPFN